MQFCKFRLAEPSPFVWHVGQPAVTRRKGDGKTDDTAAIQKAIDECEVIYVPSGDYIVSNTFALRPHTVLIGLHPSATQFDILDLAFQGPGAPKPLLEAPQGGNNIVTGIGVYAGGINSPAVGALWMAGKDSMPVVYGLKFVGSFSGGMRLKTDFQSACR